MLIEKSNTAGRVPREVKHHKHPVTKIHLIALPDKARGSRGQKRVALRVIRLVWKLQQEQVRQWVLVQQSQVETEFDRERSEVKAARRRIEHGLILMTPAI